MTDGDDDNTLSIVIHLPQPLELVAEILRAVVHAYPSASVDVSGAWRIDIPADD